MCDKSTQAKLDPDLLRLVQMTSKGDVAAIIRQLSDAGLTQRRGAVGVSIVVPEKAVASECAAFLEAVGGEVVFTEGSEILAWVPIASLAVVASRDCVTAVRAQHKAMYKPISGDPQ